MEIFSLLESHFQKKKKMFEVVYPKSKNIFVTSFHFFGKQKESLQETRVMCIPFLLRC